ncbi:uncharacterized protein [Symphalangus syndactylus]|uniref:uncharacterized protein n=1 Tax=Symphalangus syndactylus TaxID=9590 RepID=UPI00300469F5
MRARGLERLRDFLKVTETLAVGTSALFLGNSLPAQPISPVNAPSPGILGTGLDTGPPSRKWGGSFLPRSPCALKTDSLDPALPFREVGWPFGIQILNPGHLSLKKWKFLSISVPQFPPLQNGDNNSSTSGVRAVDHGVLLVLLPDAAVKKALSSSSVEQTFIKHLSSARHCARRRGNTENTGGPCPRGAHSLERTARQYTISGNSTSQSGKCLKQDTKRCAVTEHHGDASGRSTGKGTRRTQAGPSRREAIWEKGISSGERSICRAHRPWETCGHRESLGTVKYGREVDSHGH